MFLVFCGWSKKHRRRSSRGQLRTAKGSLGTLSRPTEVHPSRRPVAFIKMTSSQKPTFTAVCAQGLSFYSVCLRDILWVSVLPHVSTLSEVPASSRGPAHPPGLLGARRTPSKQASKQETLFLARAEMKKRKKKSCCVGFPLLEPSLRRGTQHARGDAYRREAENIRRLRRGRGAVARSPSGRRARASATSRGVHRPIRGRCSSCVALSRNWRERVTLGLQRTLVFGVAVQAV